MNELIPRPIEPWLKRGKTAEEWLVPLKNNLDDITKFLKTGEGDVTLSTVMVNLVSALDIVVYAVELEATNKVLAAAYQTRILMHLNGKVVDDPRKNHNLGGT